MCCTLILVCPHAPTHTRTHTHAYCTGPGLAQDGIPTGDPSLFNASAFPVSKANHVLQSLNSPLSDPSPCKSVSTPPYSPPADPIYHSSGPLSPASPSAAPYPKVTLTEEPDQAVEVSWSVDTSQRSVPSLPVKPGTSYTLKVPPQQETVVLRFNTFGKSKLQLPMQMFTVLSQNALN